MSNLFQEFRNLVCSINTTSQTDISEKNMLAVAFSNTARYSISGARFHKFLDIDSARLSIMYDEHRNEPIFLIRDRMSMNTPDKDIHQITLLELEEAKFLLDRLYANIEDQYCLSIHDFSGGYLSYFDL